MIVQHSLFFPSPLGHGGNRRTAQINELIRSIYPDVVVLGHDTPDRTSPKNKILLTLFRGLVEVIRNPAYFLLSPGIATLMNLGHLPSQLQSITKSKRPSELTIVWESTVPPMFRVIKKLRRQGVRILAFPHNVEAFSLESRNPRKMLRWLKLEAEVLGICDEVICISPFDSWLYANLGVSASTLPYAITQEARTSFAPVLDSRKTSAKNTYLILGSSTNKPTRAGILQLLEASAYSDDNTRIAVVSRGLRTFDLEKGPRRNVEVFPNLSDSLLEQELIRAKALIVMQEWGTGQLTRVHEAIEMGIPVFANELAARGYPFSVSEIPDAVAESFPGCNLVRIVGNPKNLEERRSHVLAQLSPTKACDSKVQE